MPEHVRRCQECKAFQDIRSIIPGSELVLALVVTLLSLLTAAVPAFYRVWNNRSRTHRYLLGCEKLPGSNDYVILVGVANDGDRSAYIDTNITLVWKDSGLKLPTRGLVIVNPSQRVVQPGQTSVLQLTTEGYGERLLSQKVAVMRAVAASKVEISLPILQTGITGSHWKENDESTKGNGSLISSWLENHIVFKDDCSPNCAGGASPGARLQE